VVAGFQHIDAVSFVSPKAVPQMADSEQVLERLGPLKDVEIIGIVVNEKGADRAIATGRVSTLGYPCSISETFLRKNQNQSLEENRAVLNRIKVLADEAGLAMVAYISMAFGNPYGDPWSERKVAEAARNIAAHGIPSVSIADTVGAAGPELVGRVLTTVLEESVECEVGIHMHSTRAGAAAKILAAFDAGCRRFDAAMGGLGGCPFAQDQLVGNVPTEEVLRALEQRGLKLPVRDRLSTVSAMNAAIDAEFSM
jgi:hydroxymethylglutaryl-CoA lyase